MNIVLDKQCDMCKERNPSGMFQYKKVAIQVVDLLEVYWCSYCLRDIANDLDKIEEKLSK